MHLKQHLGLLAISLFFLKISTAQINMEYEILCNLYQNTGGEHWSVQWDFDTPMSTWHGVTIKNGHVVALNLSGNNLEGEIPISLKGLARLRSLNLSGNKLYGKLPTALASLEHLTLLNLSRNRFSGIIPRGLARLYKLRSLQLADNNFGDYSELEKMQKHQLMSFDMENDFSHLELTIDLNEWSGMATAGLED